MNKIFSILLASALLALLGACSGIGAPALSSPTAGKGTIVLNLTRIAPFIERASAGAATGSRILSITTKVTLELYDSGNILVESKDITVSAQGSTTVSWPVNPGTGLVLKAKVYNALWNSGLTPEYLGTSAAFSVSDGVVSPVKLVCVPASSVDYTYGSTSGIFNLATAFVLSDPVSPGTEVWLKFTPTEGLISLSVQLESGSTAAPMGVICDKNGVIVPPLTGGDLKPLGTDRLSFRVTANEPYYILLLDAGTGNATSRGFRLVSGPGSEPLKVMAFDNMFSDNGWPDSKWNEGFQAKTNFALAVQNVNQNDYFNALQQKMADPATAPDVFLAGAAFVGKVNNSGWADDLSAAPYSADTANLYPYTVAMGKDASGVLRSLANHVVPGAIFYRRSIAQAVWGQSDPAFVAGKLATGSSMMAAAMELRDSAGKYTMWSGIDSFACMYLYGPSASWVNASKEFVPDSAMTALLDDAKAYVAGGMMTSYNNWSDEWHKEMNTPAGSAKVFAWPFPSWGLLYVIANQSNGGDWGMVPSPRKWYWGGHWFFINKAISADRKAAAWELIRSLTLDTAAIQASLPRSKEVSSNITAINAVMNDPVFNSTTLAGQNPMPIYAADAAAITPVVSTPWDQWIEKIVRDCLNKYLQGTFASSAETLAAIKAQVVKDMPDLTAP